MASRKKQEALAVAGQQETGLVKWDDELAKYAQQAADREQIVAGQFFSVRAGKLALAGQEIKGNEVNVVVLKDIFENDYYPHKFDPNNKAPPDCYAFGDDEKSMKPHEKATNPQAESCAACKHNEWGSSPKGKGKACQNRRRLAVIPAGDLTSEGVAKAEVAYFKVPVTSGRFWGAYVKALASMHKRPPFAVVTNIKVEPDEQTQVKVHFNTVEVVPKESLGAIMGRVKEQEEGIRFPYPEAKDEEKPAKPAKGKSKF